MLFFILLAITSASCHKVVESTEETEPFNTTTLIPVQNSTYTPNITESQQTETKVTTTSWKIDTYFSKENVNDSKESETMEKKEDSDKFRPSQHLGDIIEEVEPTKLLGTFRATFDSFMPVLHKPPGFISSHKGSSIFGKPHFPTRPYKFDSLVPKTRGSWKPTQDSKSTVETPVSIPAGGLYQAEVFNADDDFGLSFKDEKDGSLKKQLNPWKKLIQIMTALIPVGLIFSALTPSVITIENTGPTNQLPPRLYRRSIKSALDLPAISEACRRRLLCELQSEKNYINSAPTKRKTRHCHRIQCEDPQAVSKTLNWLLAYHKSTA